MQTISQIPQRISIVLFLLLISFANKAFAVEDPVYSTSIKGIALQANATLSPVSISDYQNASYIQQEVAVKDFFELLVDESNNTYIQSDFTFSITINITYNLPNNVSHTLSNKVLTVDYKKNGGAKFKVRDRFSFEGATSITCQIVSIDNHGGTYDPRGFITLRSGIVAIRDYKFDCSSVVNGVNLKTPINTDFDEIIVSWNDANRSTHFDIEWAWVDYESRTQYQNASGNFLSDLIFNNNSTSVTLDKAKSLNPKVGSNPDDEGTGLYHYTIPTIYEGSGYLFYRIRPVNIKESGQVIVGNWNTASGISPLSFQYAGHQNNLNWQATTSFAEEGKRKTVVQYFDGSLRSRQTVTKDNDTKHTIVAETFYDHQGRPAIQVLPAPTLGNIIKYVKDFNQFDISTIPSDLKNIYDAYPAGSLCSTPAPKLDITKAGAAGYYSVNNPEKGTSFNQFIPNANGFVFTETRYTADNTGRIASQSGLGNNYQLGGDHDTRYYYSSVDQNVLDALFGTEVGDASHYFKTMIKDANGQFSVSYADMNGKTVATALAGDNPSSLEPLISNIDGPEMSENLLADNTNIINGNSIETSKSLTVPKDGSTYKFYYRFTPRSLFMNDCVSNSIEFNCKYDLEISIIDGCGKKILDPSISFIGVTAKEINEAQFTLTLNKGEYNIYKKLSVNQTSLNEYRDQYINYFKDPACSTFNNFLTSISDAMATLNGSCSTTCQSCSTRIGTLTDFRDKFKVAIGLTASSTISTDLDTKIIGAYNNALKQCADLCTSTLNKVSAIKQSMLRDMTPPNGQYAYLSSPGSNFNAKDISVFKNVSFLGFTLPPQYRTPYNANGTLTPTPFYDNGNGVKDPSIYSSTGVLASDVQQFINNFKSNWAEQLLPYHPEYNKLILAQTTLKSSYDFDASIENTETYDQAFTQGFLNPASSKYLLKTIAASSNADPFFNITNLNPFWRGGMSMKLTQVPLGSSGGVTTYYPIWKILYSIIFNRKDPSNLSNLATAQANPSTTRPSTCPQDYDKLWQTFKAYYLTNKEIFLNKYLDDATSFNRATFYAQHNTIAKPLFSLHFDDPTSTNGGNNGGSINGTSVADLLDPNNQTTNIANATAGIAADCEANCKSYTNYWTDILNTCPQITGISSAQIKKDLINAIIVKFVDVCKGGCNENNPIGASTKAPGGSNPTDFDAALTMVFNQFNSTYSTLNLSVNEFCNKFIFENPKPYDKQVADNNNSYIVEPVKPSDCLCDKIRNEATRINNSIASGGGSPLSHPDLITNISYYLMPIEYKMPTLNTTKQTEFKNLIEILYDGCYGLPSTTACNFYNPPIQIPPALQCGTASQNCITCYQYHSLKQTFISTYAIPVLSSVYANVPYTTDATTPVLSDAQIKANEFFASFLNYKTGFSFDWTRYAQFEKVECPYSSSARMSNSSDSTSVPNDSTSIDSTTGARISGTTYRNVILCANENHLVTPTPADDNPCNDYLALALNQAYEQYNTYIAQLADDFGLKYTEKCLEAKTDEKFRVKHSTSEYHYTLYYYDQAGNLVKTVPPAGVDNHTAYSGGTVQFITDVKSMRVSGSTKLPTHKLVTEYRYNSLNQVVAQKTPDAGVSQFWYDRLGRVVISQNAQQKVDNNYSYTIYDDLGRISEVGQKPLGSTAFNGQTTTQDQTNLFNFITTGGTNRSQITRTIYDLPYTFLCSVSSPSTSILCQENLRNRVSYSMVIDNESGAPPNITVGGWKSATFYSYDIHGNVNTLVQSYRNGVMATHNEYKTIKYDYDLISGKVNQVAYQPGDVDAFYHHYEYDAENRLTSTYTTKDAFSKDLDFFWEKEAAYSYYRHSALARTELGQNRVQGLDYAYTLQGWLKGVNSTAVNVDYDMGNDGKATTVNEQFAKDAYGYSLNYFNGDYSPINSSLTNQPFASIIASLPSADQRSLYNGNISAMAVNITKLGNPMLYNYKYDQLNRIVSMDAFSGLTNNNASFTPIKLNDYKERVSYDANGNILTYLRNGDASRLNMDDMVYTYKPYTNQLDKVIDNANDAAVADYGRYNDIKKYPLIVGGVPQQQSNNNYVYDKIGNLISDASEGISSIEWTVYGKIKKITKNKTVGSTSITSYIEYQYDASGNRISKTITPDITKTSGIKTTSYVRDASGNIMSIYEKNQSLNNNDLTQTELNLFGSSRLGTYNVNVNVDTRIYNTTIMIGVVDGKGYSSNFERGSKYYELSNHLGNVLATISDKKIQIPATNGVSIIGYSADVTNATDYYPFGMAMPGRNGHAVQGGWANGSTTINGNNYASDLTITDRYNATPIEYTATNTISFIGEYVDNGNDDYIAYIVDDNTTTGSSGTYNQDKYRYGFNGKENDKDISEGGQDYGMRIYDGRICKFLSVDPLEHEYPELTPYQFSGNSPITFFDRDGEEMAYKMPDGSVYYHPPSDHLRVPIPQSVRDNGQLMGAIPGDGGFTQGFSTVLDFVPVVGTIKGGIEGLVGYDMAGNKLSPLERGLGLVPYLGKVKKVATVIKVEKAAEKIIKVEKTVQAVTKSEKVIASTERAIVKKYTGKEIEALRRKAVRDAWKQEKNLLKETGEGTREWTAAEKKEILETGKVKGYDGHHINNVKDHPELAGEANNIEFVTKDEHLGRHNGNFKNKTTGDPVNRSTGKN